MKQVSKWFFARRENDFPAPYAGAPQMQSAKIAHQNRFRNRCRSAVFFIRDKSAPSRSLSNSRHQPSGCLPPRAEIAGRLTNGRFGGEPAAVRVAGSGESRTAALGGSPPVRVEALAWGTGRSRSALWDLRLLVITHRRRRISDVVHHGLVQRTYERRQTVAVVA